uniref:NAD binding dehydrogenase n=1 Tax=Kwoniella pini CBS 10737 TaxID=1296096 RepID=A0A1B9IE93_9TREE|nr:NAD binding dehydrogenase [Kwoniella pini CBS 10737]OCF53876.1 NAD binding dehydrogenase [Kwoniella pini CBS 10737]
MSTSTNEFHVIMVGAGFAMFGTPEGPWNIAKRAEAKLGERLKVDAVIEVDPKRAEAALKIKSEGPHKSSYENTVILPSVAEFKKLVDQGKAPEPRAIFVATPPTVRGSTLPGKDLEIQLNRAFPNVAIFFEKPVATGKPWEESVGEALKVSEYLKANHKAPISIGYVLRYLKIVQQVKKIIEENNLTVMATNARFVVAYELAVKTDWWNKDIQLGPVIEQATHICDLVRFLGGEIDFNTISAHALEAHEKPGQLSKKNFDESVIPDHLRIPRATSASWKYESGAVGIFLHSTALHGTDYEVQLEVYADGVSDPCAPELLVRRPGSDEFEKTVTPGDDAYQTEMNHFIDAIEGGAEPEIFSSYEDAAKTYEMTWVIRNSAENANSKIKEQKGGKSYKLW